MWNDTSSKTASTLTKLNSLGNFHPFSPGKTGRVNNKNNKNTTFQRPRLNLAAKSAKSLKLNTCNLPLLCKSGHFQGIKRSQWCIHICDDVPCIKMGDVRYMWLGNWRTYFFGRVLCVFLIVNPFLEDVKSKPWNSNESPSNHWLTHEMQQQKCPKFDVLVWQIQPIFLQWPFVERLQIVD